MQSAASRGARALHEQLVPGGDQDRHENCCVLGQSVGARGACGSQRHSTGRSPRYSGRQGAGWAKSSMTVVHVHWRRWVAPQSIGAPPAPTLVVSPPAPTLVVSPPASLGFAPPADAAVPPAPGVPPVPSFPRSPSPVRSRTLPAQPLVSDAPTTTMLFRSARDFLTGQEYSVLSELLPFSTMLGTSAGPQLDRCGSYCKTSKVPSTRHYSGVSGQRPLFGVMPGNLGKLCVVPVRYMEIVSRKRHSRTRVGPVPP